MEEELVALRQLNDALAAENLRLDGVVVDAARVEVARALFKVLQEDPSVIEALVVRLGDLKLRKMGGAYGEQLELEIGPFRTYVPFRFYDMHTPRSAFVCREVVPEAVRELVAFWCRELGVGTCVRELLPVESTPSRWKRFVRVNRAF